MVEPKIGDQYFEIRARLGTAIFALSRLAGELEVHPARVQMLEDLLKNLRQPFLFVVAGEVNSGKSTLLNALFGDYFCEVNVTPETSKICHFRWGQKARDVEISDTLVDRYRPNDFLQDFHVVDTPGTNSIVDEHQEITEQFIPLADLVVFTFSVSNPWGGTAWELLSRIHRRWFRNVIFVLQQCDIRSADEVDAIMEHIRFTALQKLGAEFPIFPVSGKLAYMAKKGPAEEREEHWEKSGFEDFETYISDLVDSPQTREARLGNVARSARLVLREVKRRLSTAAEILKADEILLSGLDQTVSAQKARTMEKFSALFRSLDSEYMDLSIDSTAWLQDRLGIASAFQGKKAEDATIEHIEGYLVNQMIAKAEAQVIEASCIIEDDLDHLWRYLAEEMQTHFHFQLRVGTESGRPEWGPQRRNLKENLVETLQRNLPGLSIRELLRPRLRRRRWALITLSTLSLLIVLSSVVVYFLGIVEEHLLTAGIAAASALVLSLMGWGFLLQKSSNNAVHTLSERFNDHREHFRQILKAALTEEVDGFFEDFLSLFRPLHQLCEDHRTRYQPQVRDIQHLDQSFDEIDRLIGVPALPEDAPMVEAGR